MKYYIRNVNVVTEYGILWDGAVLTENDRILACAEEKKLPVPEGTEVVDGMGLYAGPGLIDIHNHGIEEWSFDEKPYEAAAFELAHGTTTVLPTFYMTLPKEGFLRSIALVKEAMAKGDAVSAAIGGFYMEGPYMNPKYGSNHALCAWKDACTAEDYKEVVDAGGELVKVWAVDPERENIEEFIRYAKKVNPGVMISCGHCEAMPESIRRLRRLGLGLQTHCTNATGIQHYPSACSGIKGVGPNEADWLDDDMYAEIISDSLGIHVHPDMQKLIWKIKGTDRVVLITDSGPQDGPNPPDKAEVTDLIFAQNGHLSGSKITLNQACRNFMHHTRAGITECFLMASRNPARVIGIDEDYGTIEPGKKADIILVNDRFDVKKVMKNGEFITSSLL